MIMYTYNQKSGQFAAAYNVYFNQIDVQRVIKNAWY